MLKFNLPHTQKQHSKIKKVAWFDYNLINLSNTVSFLHLKYRKKRLQVNIKIVLHSLNKSMA